MMSKTDMGDGDTRPVLKTLYDHTQVRAYIVHGCQVE